MGSSPIVVTWTWYGWWYAPELFTGLSWRQYLEEMSKSGTYGDEITLHAMANMLLVEIVVILTLWEEGRTITTPKASISYHTLVLGYFAPVLLFCHYVALQRDGHRSVENSYVADNDPTNRESDADIANDYTDVPNI